MNKKFNVDIVSFKKISKIDNAWNSEDYKALLSMMDIEEDELAGMNDTELLEMCLMSLSDFEHHESAKFLLSYIFKDTLTEGKIDQLGHEMANENLWEEFADPAYHMKIFNAYELLRKAYNGTFSEPTGVKLTIKISANQKDSFEMFDTSLCAVIVRLLAQGLSETAILNRLYEEQLSGTNFPDAQNILWILKEISKTDTQCQYEIISSDLWLGDFEDVISFEATAHADIEEDEDK